MVECVVIARPFLTVLTGREELCLNRCPDQLQMVPQPRYINDVCQLPINRKSEVWSVGAEGFGSTLKEICNLNLVRIPIFPFQPVIRLGEFLVAGNPGRTS